MQIVIHGALGKIDEDRCIQRLTEKVPIGLIEKLYLDVSGDEVNISYVLRNIPEKRKMGGYCIGSPEGWNAAKQAELRETLPNWIA